jgi:hypothetical protein
MTADELTAGCYRARVAFHTAGSIARRFCDPLGAVRTPRNAVQFLLSNVISRREIHTKQGLLLGGPEGLELPESLGPMPVAAGIRGAAAAPVVAGVAS